MNLNIKNVEDLVNNRGENRENNNNNINKNNNNNKLKKGFKKEDKKDFKKVISHSQHVLKKLKSEKRCFKYLKSEHKVNDTNVSCKSEARFIKKQVTVLLKSLKVKLKVINLNELSEN